MTAPRRAVLELLRAASDRLSAGLIALWHRHPRLVSSMSGLAMALVPLFRDWRHVASVASDGWWLARGLQWVTGLVLLAALLLTPADRLHRAPDARPWAPWLCGSIWAWALWNWALWSGQLHLALMGSLALLVLLPPLSNPVSGLRRWALLGGMLLALVTVVAAVDSTLAQRVRWVWLGPITESSRYSGHYEAWKHMGELAKVQPWGPSSASSEWVFRAVLPRWPMEMAMRWGWVPMVGVLSVAVLGYAAWALAAWRHANRLERGEGSMAVGTEPPVRRELWATPLSPTRMARLVAALAALHAIAALGAFLFTVGLLHAPLGRGVPPLANSAAWWVLSVGLVLASCWLVWGSRSTKRCETQPRSHPPDALPVQAPFRPMGCALVCAGHALRQHGLAPTVMALLMTVGGWQVQTAQREWLAMQPARPSAGAWGQRPTVQDGSGLPLALDQPAVDLVVNLPRLLGEACQDSGQAAASPCVVNDAGVQRWDTMVRLLADHPDALRQWRQRIPRPTPGSTVKRSQPVYPVQGLPIHWRPLGSPSLPAGVGTRAGVRRVYPQGELFAHALGFTARPDRTGQEGLERVLGGPPQRSTGPQTAEPVLTTLDRLTQRLARDALAAAIRIHQAQGGAAAVVDARSGAIRALVSAPDFDPNLSASFRGEATVHRVFNHATANLMPLGDLWRPLVLGMALEDGVGVTANWASQGASAKGNGEQARATVGDATLAAAMPVERLRRWLRDLGLEADPRRGLANDRPIWGLPEVLQGLPLPDPPRAPTVLAGAERLLHAPLLRVLQAYQPMASDGFMRALHLVTPDTALPSASAEPRPCDACGPTRMFRPETVVAMRSMLDAEVRQGNGSAAQPPELQSALRVGGKAATLHSLTPDLDSRVRAGHRAVFVAMAPIEAPRWLIGVVLHFDPTATGIRTSPTGNDSAGPVVADIVRGLVQHERAHGLPIASMRNVMP